MAAVAFDRLVFLLQEVFCVAIVIEHAMLPALRNVAGFALVAIQPFVDIPFLVAGNTPRRGLFLDRGHFVAIFAFDLHVPAEQDILRISVVIEGSREPAFFVVAGLASLAKHRVVDIISSMTPIANRRGLVLIQPSLMTTLALDSRVFLSERIGGMAIVVERNVSPAMIGMARFAFLAELALMPVIFLVT